MAVETGCAVTSVSAPTTFPIVMKAICHVQYTGTWTAYSLANVINYFNADGSSTGVNDIYMWGRATDNTCGELHVNEQYAIDATGNESGHDTILDGKEDWEGSRGSFDTHGIVLIPGEAAYAGVWTRPARPGRDSSDPCVPPTPTDFPLPSSVPAVVGREQTPAGL